MTIEERLEVLERELGRAKHRNRWLLAAVGVAVAVLTLAWTWNKNTPAAQAQVAPPGAPGKVIRANEFILEDADGKTRAILSVGEAGPGLLLIDEKGKPRAMLNVNKDGPRLILYDANGKAISQAP
jgi:hypothetical protein